MTDLLSKMDQLSLMALLKCPLCLEKLDASARVLPCQHTFCVSCLQRQEAAHAQLLCPECGAPVPVKTVQELPENLLLVQLLQGLQTPRNSQRVHHPPSSARGSEDQQLGDSQGHSEPAHRTSMHNQLDDASAETDVNPAKSIGPNHKEDDSWQYADLSERSTPLCRAMCDFIPEKMNAEDNKYCLGFCKGDVLTIFRQADEHWVEAKRGEKVGYCPLQFLEPNSAAAKLLKRRTRSDSDSAESQHHTERATDAPNRTSHYGVPQVLVKTLVINTATLPTLRKQPSASSNFHHTNISTSNGVSRQGQPQRFPLPSAELRHSHHSRVSVRRSSRHSDSHRQHLQSEIKMTSETPPTITMALLNPQMTSASTDGKNSSTQQLSISVCAVLYNYKPRRAEELELRKGEMVGVYGKFKEGWLRGLSLRTGKVGILPSNYVTPVLRTSARLLETKTANTSLQYNPATGKKPTAANNPAVVLAFDRVNGDGASYSAGQVPSVANGSQHAKPSFYGSSQGWDTVRRIFNPHRSSNYSSQLSTLNVPSNSQHFAQVQASGYSPALQRKKNNSLLSNPIKALSRMTEPVAPSAAGVLKDREFTSHELTFQHYRQPTVAPQSILVKPDTHKCSSNKPQKSVRFVTEEDSPPPRRRTSSWSSGTQIGRPGPRPLEVWAPSLTLGRDGPGIILKEGRSPVLRRGLETAISDVKNTKPLPSQPPLSALSFQYSPSRHRMATTHLAQTDSEISLLQGEMVLVHRPQADGRVLVTQESTGQTGVFHSGVLQCLERLS
uniref:SH3 domain containing ring finger 2 n=1 Tax=Oryzias latipes TaxID=8090 RepID=A0A3P9H4Q1_ORYLA